MKEVKEKLLEELKKFVNEKATPLEEIQNGKWVDESKSFLENGRRQINESLMKWALKKKKVEKKVDPFEEGNK